MHSEGCRLDLQISRGLDYLPPEDPRATHAGHVAQRVSPWSSANVPEQKRLVTPSIRTVQGDDQRFNEKKGAAVRIWFCWASR